MSIDGLFYLSFDDSPRGARRTAVGVVSAQAGISPPVPTTDADSDGQVPNHPSQASFGA